MKLSLPLSFMLSSLLITLSSAAEAQCELSPSNLQASYQLTSSDNSPNVSSKNSSHTSKLNLWRQGNTVAHQYPQTDITESWFLLNNKQIKPTRFFDHYQRGIEYQPGEVVHGKSEHDWSYRYQFISDKLISQLTLSAETGKGCERQQVLTQTSANSKIELVWLPELQLISRFSWTKNQGKHQTHEQWQLTELSHDANKITAFFKHLNHYKMTDYADIGDDHSDEFLTKMVTLGFVEHGASGFYDTEGKAISDGHSHSH
ncbi:hypothetical protein [Shewanella sp. TC10]|uniref:hypothetical protein n=1 Tax=Shewanella sp. TC10 TaxID=1419739 RepID=UPI001E3CE367|nr:hypothetical protein [Shewanella sp. TC10]